MKFGAIADSHFKAVEPWGRIDAEAGINTRLRYKLGMLRQALQSCVDQDCDFVVLIGDIFDTYNVPGWLRAAVGRVLSPFVSKIPIIYVPGNHDSNVVGVWESEGLLSGGLLGSDDDQLEYPGELRNGFYYIRKPVQIFHDNLGLLFVPYEHRGQLRSLHTKTKADIVFSHFFIQGAKISESNTPLSLKGKGVPSSIVEPYPLVLLGDIHIPQTLPYTKYGVHYPGQLCHLIFNEGDHAPGYLIVDVKPKLVLNQFVIRNDEVKLPFAEIDSVDIKRYELNDWIADKVVVSEGQDVDAILESACRVYNIEEKIVPDGTAFVLKIVIKGSKTFCDSFPKRKWRTDLLNQNVERIFFETEVTQTSMDKATPIFKGSLSDRWIQYANLNTINPEAVVLVANRLQDLVK